MKQVSSYGRATLVAVALAWASSAVLAQEATPGSPATARKPAAAAPAAASAPAGRPGPGMGPGMGGMGPGMQGMGPRGHRHGHRGGPGRFGPGNTPGWGMMNPQERAEHRNKMRSFKSHEDCSAYIAQHHEQMSARAKEQGRTPPAGPRHDPCAWLKP